MLRKLAWLLVLAFPLSLAVGCGSPDVEYPEKPTPPPGQDPVTTSTPQPGQDG